MLYPDVDAEEAANEEACNVARKKAGLQTFKFNGDECDCEECPLNTPGKCPCLPGYKRGGP